ncbi:MAG: hypothetical protein ACI9OU_002424 [Candidatus Promineifilaceae bacterium]|jgi:hypothetical protein
MRPLYRVMSVVAVLAMSGSVAYARAPQTYQLGPTGLFGTISKTTVKVTQVAKGSPADGKIKVGDLVVGAGVSSFKKDVRRELALAIDAAESEKGRLTLTLKGDKTVDLELTVLGRYSKTAPYNCPKSDAIITRAADFLVSSGNVDKGSLHTGLLGLMATGQKSYIDVAAKVIQSATWAKPNLADINALLLGDKDMGYVGWYWGYDLITLCEYHLLTGDASVLPAIKTYAVALAKGQDAGGLWGHRMATQKRNGRLPGYAQMNQSSLSCFMGMLLAQTCGIEDPDLTRGVEKTYAYYATFIGKGAFNYGVHGPNTKAFNNNGTSGSGAICMSLLDNQEGATFFSQLAATAYDGLETGHASTFFNPLWTPLGANLSGPEVTQQFFRKSLWLQTMYRSWDGGFSRFGGNSKEGSQAGSALLAYCLPRRTLRITGKHADASIWLKGQAASDVVDMSTLDYKGMSNEALMALARDHAIPQVRRFASGALGERREALKLTYAKFLKDGTSSEKMLAIGQYGWSIPIEKKLPLLDDIGAILRDTEADLDVRVAAAESVAYFGEPAHKYYADIVTLIGQERPDDRFGDIEWALGKCLSALCQEPFSAGLVKDSALHYRVALALTENKRQHVRADGLKMLADMPLEDFHLVADQVMHVIEDRDSTYHSYHSAAGPVGAGITILAHLNIEEGMQYILDVLDRDSGKWGFKVRMAMAVLPKYGANAKDALETLRTDPRLKTIEKGRFGGPWRAMVKTIEADQNPRPLLSFDEAKKAGKQKEKLK